MTLTLDQKHELYARGHYQFPPPPVPHTSWTVDDWIRYIDTSGVWTLPDREPSSKWTPDYCGLSHLKAEHGHATVTTYSDDFASWGYYSTTLFTWLISDMVVTGPDASRRAKLAAEAYQPH